MRAVCIQHRPPAADLLPQRERGGVLQVGAADLHDVGEGRHLAVERSLAEAPSQARAPSLHRDDASDMHRGRERIVRALRTIHIIVGMYRVRRPLPQQFVALGGQSPH